MQPSAQLLFSLRELPGRVEAEAALAAACRGGRHFFAVAFLAPHAHLLFDNIGTDAAERALQAFGRRLAGAIRRGDGIYRWTATSFLLLIERPGCPDAVRQEIDALPVTALRRVFSAWGAPSTRLARQIDLFVATHLETAPASR